MICFIGTTAAVDELDRFSRLVHLLQEAALGQNLWDAVVLEIVAATGGSEGILFSPELPPSMGGFWASRAILPHHMETYAKHYCSKDVWRHSRPNLYRIDGRLIPDEELIDPVSMRRSEFYCDFLKQLEVGRLVCGVVHSSDSPAVAGGLLLSIFKPMHEQGFDAQQQDLVKRLLPHVQAAFNTWRILGAHQRTHELSYATLNALATAVLLINRESRILFANEAAEGLFADADGLAMRNGVLVGATVRETARIQAFVAGLFSPLNGARGTYVHPVARPSGKRAYACFAPPLRPSTGMYDLTSTQATILFIRDPASRRTLEPEVLEQLYGLTHCEALLASLLAQGVTLHDAAAARGISYETARCQLKNVFSKTGCRRQAELLALLAEECRR
jgi:DNA-binding CsgD family transcriptional regulator